MVGYDLYRLCVSQAPCLEGVFRHQITSLLFYHDVFYCEWLQSHLPNNAPIHDLQPFGLYFTHMSSEVALQIEYKAESFGPPVGASF